MSNIRYAMVIDQRRCIGCHTCAIACKSENNMPDGGEYALNKVITEGSTITDLPIGSPLTNLCTLDDYDRVAGKVRLNFLTRSCQHCKDAPCVSACPTNATYQREDGIVDQDTRLCIGCMKCMEACPYEMGTMRVLTKNPTFAVDFVSGNQSVYPTINETVKKCTFCAHRNPEEGGKPFCIDHCPGRARYFGNINDTSGDVYKLTHGTRRVRTPFEVRSGRVKPEPAVYYLDPED